MAATSEVVSNGSEGIAFSDGVNGRCLVIIPELQIGHGAFRITVAKGAGRFQQRITVDARSKAGKHGVID